MSSCGQCIASHSMAMPLRSIKTVGQAFRAGLALGGRISKSICNRRASSTPPIFNATLRAAATGRLSVSACSLAPFSVQRRALYRWSGSERVENGQLTCSEIRFYGRRRISASSHNWEGIPPSAPSGLAGKGFPCVVARSSRIAADMLAHA